MHTLDLQRYCARTGYAGAHEPTLETLRHLIEHHISAIPFENIDVLLNRAIDISPAAVQAKLVAGKRGGYCFEHNGLFKRVLSALGFQVESLAARVLWRAEENAAPRPRTHSALRIALDGQSWLVDVGFGGWVPTAPLLLSQTEPQTAHRETFRITPHGGSDNDSRSDSSNGSGAVIVETQLDGVWRALYELSPEPLLDVDYEPLNWFTWTHPASHFRKDLMVARTTRDTRTMLMNRRLAIRHRDGSDERYELDAKTLATALADNFGLAVDPSWQPLLERIADTAN